MEGGVAPVYSDFVAEEKRPTTEEITGKHTCQRTGGKGDVRAVQAEEAAWAGLETLPALASVAKWLEQQPVHYCCLSALPFPVPDW